MKIGILLVSLILVIHAQSMSQARIKTDTFYLKLIHHTKTQYIKAHREGNLKLTLYSDSTFDYETSSHGAFYIFSSGRWIQKHDSLIHFVSDIKTFDKVFLRSSRRSDKEIYIFKTLDNYYFRILPSENYGLLIH